MSTAAIPGQAPVWDDRRNSSQMRPGSGSAKDCLAAFARLRDEQPRLAAWLEAGAPPIHSEDEHVRWFGTTYERRKR